MKSITVAIDAMGGDNDPLVSISAAISAINRYHNLRLIIFGDRNKIPSELIEECQDKCDFVHVDHNLGINNPLALLRQMDKTSMGQAICAVHSKKADAIVSAGNTGALMAMAKHKLKTIPNIERPAICGLWPTHGQSVTFLDLGANTVATSEQLLQFAIMGNAFHSVYFNQQNPTCGLLNIGTEEHKGTKTIQDARKLLESQKGIGGKFIGYIESRDIFKGNCDVIVTDGFSGNTALKAAEGGIEFTISSFNNAFNSNIFTKLFALTIKQDLKKKLKKIYNAGSNAAMMVGLEGICIKSHGNSNTNGFLNAIDTAISLARGNINEKIKSRISKTHQIKP